MPDVRSEGRARQLAIDSTLVAVAALGIFAVVYHLWDAHLGVPFEYLGPDASPLVYAPDAPFYMMLAKGAIDHGWFLSNPSLGFPFGQTLYDFPQSLDNLNLAILQVIGWTTHNPFVTVNVFFTLTFVGISVSGFLVARRLGLSRLAAGVVALLYTFLPYHFARGSAHLLLSAYWAVPLGALLLVAVVSERPPFTRDRDDGRWSVSLRSGSAVLWLLACAALASTGSYYCAITMTLLVAIAGIDFLARRRRRVLASAGIALGAIALVLVVNLSPSFVYWAQHGRNADIVKRGPSETEVNGLKISQLVLPTEGHRVGLLADLQADSTRFSIIPAERGQQLGLIGAIGLVGLLGAVLVAARRPRSGQERDAPAASPGDPASARPTWTTPPPGDVVRVFGIATIVAILVGAVSGFSLLLAGLGLSEIRSWNRVSIFIGFFALVTAGFGFDWLRGRLPERAWRLPATVAAAVVLVVVGVLDQVSPRVTPDYAAAQARFDSDAEFFHRVERTLPEGAAVFNVPYLFFPESGKVKGVGPYDSARGFLHTDHLEWSWGGEVGTEADWAAGAAQSSPPEMLDRVVAMGFEGLVFDRRGYDDDGFRELGITLVAGPPAFESTDGTLAFYDLRDYAREARARLGPDGMRATRARALRDVGHPRQRG